MPNPNVANLDLSIKSGSRFVQPIEVAVNGVLSPFPPGTTAKMQIRASPGNSVVLSELTSTGGELVVNEGAATVTITMSSVLTAGFAFERGVYDLVLTYPDTNKEAILEGKVFVFPSVTR